MIKEMKFDSFEFATLPERLQLNFYPHWNANYENIVLQCLPLFRVVWTDIEDERQVGINGTQSFFGWKLNLKENLTKSLSVFFNFSN